MKYYSEILKKNFDTEEDCINAEKDQELLKAQRKDRALEINQLIDEYYKKYEESTKELQELRNGIIELKNKFIEDFGSFNYSYKTTLPAVNFPVTFSDMLKLFFDF